MSKKYIDLFISKLFFLLTFNILKKDIFIPRTNPSKKALDTMLWNMTCKNLRTKGLVEDKLIFKKQKTWKTVLAVRMINLSPLVSQSLIGWEESCKSLCTIQHGPTLLMLAFRYLIFFLENWKFTSSFRKVPWYPWVSTSEKCRLQ